MKEETKIELVKGVLSTADTLIQWAFLLNGAAAAGLLTFVGNASSERANFHNWDLFGSSLIVFSIGLLLAVSTTFGKMMTLNFLAQLDDPQPHSSPEDIKIWLLVGDRAVIYGLCTLALFALSMLCFIAGVVLGKIAVFG